MMTGNTSIATHPHQYSLQKTMVDPVIENQTLLTLLIKINGQGCL